MVAGPEPIAVEEGLKVLREGGNAVDAAVTMGFLLAVTLPHAGNIGGGGYMLLRTPAGEEVFIDYRETAPAAATAGMFLDSAGAVIPDDSRQTYRAVGVPGTVAGLALALEKFGTISFARALEPAIRHARNGFAVNRGLETAIEAGRKRLARYPASAAIFLPEGSPPAEGYRLVQKDLAATLETLVVDGPRSFYEGRIARVLAADMKAHGGLIDEEDLAGYRAVIRPAVRGSYRTFDVISAPPSSSGGIALLQMLRMLEPHDLRGMGRNSSSYAHLLAESMKRAFADRARWLGDPDFVEVPVTGLLSGGYANRLMKSFDPARATPATQAGPGDPLPFEKESTTHYSIVDSNGGVVSNTYTLNGWFGCGALVEGLGFLLNNEMDDFSIKPGTANMFDLVDGQVNAIAPGKRMLSSMSPTIVLERLDGGSTRPVLVLGSPGGPAIITSVLQVMLNVLEFDMDLQAAVDAPRLHHQWQPDRLYLDDGEFPHDVIEALKRRGHEVVERSRRGEVQAILLDHEAGWLRGASDARGFGAARGN